MKALIFTCGESLWISFSLSFLKHSRKPYWLKRLMKFLHRRFPQKLWQKMSILRKYCKGSVQMGAISGLVFIFKLKYRHQLMADGQCHLYDVSTSGRIYAAFDGSKTFYKSNVLIKTFCTCSKWSSFVNNIV